ncbi:MAG: KAP family P-loop domain [Bacteriophage sp.]|jgi:hypothetical protein|nr:MAG: KAP family P-loop domain [Bacteriophage sp.]
MEISISKETERFADFLKQKDNENIIFSGAFGIGKSYFLNNFFNQHKDKYTGIYLTPINYSVANNEDIFEYIKVDILMQLLEKVPYDFEKQKISLSNAAYFYMVNHPKDFWGNFFSIAEKITFGTDIIDRCITLKENIETYAKDNSKNEESHVKKFFDSISIEKGSIYEDDTITQIIRSIVSSTQTDNSPNKQIVLIIDDLDRIDPEHIFRILNILSAHNDFCGTEEHKFGFDKVILVCDIDNIRNIYSAKYGINVDFNGYIDKFYSKEVYHFDNSAEIIKNITDILFKLNSTQDIGLNNSNYYSHQICHAILSTFVRNKSVNIRTLLKCINKNIKADRIINLGNKRIVSCDFPSLVIFDFIRTMFSTSKDMEAAISKLNKSNFNKDISEFILSFFISLADFHYFEIGTYTYYGKEYRIQIHSNMGLIDFAKGEVPDIDPSLVLKEAFNTYNTLFV